MAPAPRRRALGPLARKESLHACEGRLVDDGLVLARVDLALEVDLPT
jgi:hypothetical protein